MKKSNQSFVGLLGLGLLVSTLFVCKMDRASGGGHSTSSIESSSGKSDSIPSLRVESSGAMPSSIPPKEGMSAAEFSELTHQTLLSLPLLADLQKLSAHDAHDTPRTLVDAALKVGTIVEEAEKNLEFHSMALDFYQRCALGEYSVSLRATCYDLLRRADAGTAASLDIPSYVIRLADAE